MRECLMSFSVKRQSYIASDGVIEAIDLVFCLTFVALEVMSLQTRLNGCEYQQW